MSLLHPDDTGVHEFPDVGCDLGVLEMLLGSLGVLLHLLEDLLHDGIHQDTLQTRKRNEYASFQNNCPSSMLPVLCLPGLQGPAGHA